MKDYVIRPFTGGTRRISVPPDKSISHRALMISALCRGETRIERVLRSDDTAATLGCMRKLGVSVFEEGDAFIVRGSGKFFTPQEDPLTLFAGESGTTMRILSGILAGQKFSSRFEAQTSLENRPMNRIIVPLREMGADIRGVPRCVQRTGREEECPPLDIRSVGHLHGKSFRLPIASAQVKSALLLAGLYAEEATEVTEPAPSRDHTERMLRLFGCGLQSRGTTVRGVPDACLATPGFLRVPGDFSSAAFFLVLGLIVPGSRLVLKDVNVNPTRCGLLDVLRRMGARIRCEQVREEYEPVCDLVVETSSLRATVVEPGEIPQMIDEIPVLCVAAAFASGRTEIRGVSELKVKETDRVWSMVSNLDRAGVAIHDEDRERGECSIVIEGKKKYRPARFESCFDHRTAMSLIVFASALEGESEIDDVRCIHKSFPEFIPLMEQLRASTGAQE
ncbi:MAG: 3-phosphoshikimate 1-carboxyvinyltransferase [Candidatus Omnitrophica bacterium]|nr:3-phosphoshikimate 1-carboxyvinyltransferase [Candidatus Omnitrophota bacterium]